MRKKLKTLKVKQGSFWVFIFLERFNDDIWNIAITTSKSQRGARDWYWRRKNKRSAHAGTNNKKAGIQHLRAAFELTKKAVTQLPAGDSIISMPTSEKRSAMSKYLERIGFAPIQMGDQHFWVLTIPES